MSLCKQRRTQLSSFTTAKQCSSLKPIWGPCLLIRKRGSKYGVQFGGAVKEMQVMINQHQKIICVPKKLKSPIFLSQSVKNLYLKRSKYVAKEYRTFLSSLCCSPMRHSKVKDKKEVDEKEDKYGKANAFAADWFYFWLWKQDHLLSLLTQSRWIQNILLLVFIVLKSLNDPVRGCFNQKDYNFLFCRYLAYLMF